MIRFQLRLSPEHAAALFAGLVQIDLVQLREMGLLGQTPVLNGLHAGAALRAQGILPKTAAWDAAVAAVRESDGTVPLYYEKLDPEEHVKDTQTVLADGFGDCDDLAPSVAAELMGAGFPAVPVSYAAQPDTWHVVVKWVDPLSGVRWIDPSRLGGM